jgi:hypothetical protein
MATPEASVRLALLPFTPTTIQYFVMPSRSAIKPGATDLTYTRVLVRNSTSPSSKPSPSFRCRSSLETVIAILSEGVACDDCGLRGSVHKRRRFCQVACPPIITAKLSVSSVTAAFAFGAATRPPSTLDMTKAIASRRESPWTVSSLYFDSFKRKFLVSVRKRRLLFLVNKSFLGLLVDDCKPHNYWVDYFSFL